MSLNNMDLAVVDPKGGDKTEMLAEKSEKICLISNSIKSKIILNASMIASY